MDKTELEKLIKLFKTDNITESSARIYALNILKLSKDFNIKLDENSFLDFDINNIKNDENISDNTKKNKIISIIKYLKAYNSSKEIIQKFSDEADIFSSKIDRKKRKLEKTEKEKENWITKKEIMDKIDELRKLVKDVLKDIMNILEDDEKINKILNKYFGPTDPKFEEDNMTINEELNFLKEKIESGKDDIFLNFMNQQKKDEDNNI